MPVWPNTVECILNIKFFLVKVLLMTNMLLNQTSDVEIVLSGGSLACSSDISSSASL